MILIWFNEMYFKIPLLTVLTPYGYLAGTFLIGYFSVRQNEIFPFEKNEMEAINEIIQEETENKPLRQQRLSADQLLLYKEKLDHLMKSEKVFLNCELGLPQLAKMLAISSHQLSFLINKGYDKNFFQLINHFRVEEAKKLLISDTYNTLSVVGIAFESGFKSKTTFNTTFKKITGMSPTEFRQTHPKAENEG